MLRTHIYITEIDLLIYRGRKYCRYVVKPYTHVYQMNHFINILLTFSRLEKTFKKELLLFKHEESLFNSQEKYAHVYNLHSRTKTDQIFRTSDVSCLLERQP